MDAVKKVLRQKININQKDIVGNTALHLLSGSYSNTDIVKLLLQSGAKVNLQNKNGDTPIHIACEQGNEDVVLMLIATGANINVKNKMGNTPLHNACVMTDTGCRSKIVQLLLTLGANIRVKNKYGILPLDYALRSECVDVIERLIDATCCVSGCKTISLNELHENEWLNQQTKKKLLRRVKTRKGLSGCTSLKK